jgi:hypothetical protein
MVNQTTNKKKEQNNEHEDRTRNEN